VEVDVAGFIDIAKNAMNALGTFTKNKPYSIVFERGEIWLKLANGVELLLEKEFPSISWFIFTMKEFEEFDREIIKGLLRPGDVFFDIGANVGLHSLDAANEIPEIKIHAFEPIKSTYATLVKNVERNNLQDKITCNRLALGAVSERVFMTSKFQSCNYVADQGSLYDVEEVQCTTVDEYIRKNNITKLDFIKIDVECHEGAVLQGAVTTLSRLQPVVFMEITKANPKEWSERKLSDITEIFKTMEDLGYTYCVLDDNDGMYTKENIKGASLTRYYHNYIFYPASESTLLNVSEWFKNWFVSLLKKRNWINGDRLTPALEEHIISTFVTKKIIVFGAGQIYKKKLQPILKSCEINTAYFLDNDITKVNTTMDNIPIFAADALKKEDQSLIYIFIASMHYNEIKKQLEGMGFNEYEHFIQVE
jgi:FkbM family methyltransferase